jgi:hypothetical protein
MLAIAPDTKIILVVRNQVDLIASRYSEYVIGGGQHDFDSFVREFLCCSEDGINYFQNYYSRILEIFRKDFSSERVHIILQEDLLRNETSVINRLCQFLNIEVRQPTKRGLRAQRIGLSAAGLNYLRIFNRAVVLRPQRSYERTQARIPYLFYKFCVRVFRVFDYYLPKRIKGDKKEFVTGDVAERIRGVFREDNERLSNLLGSDLSTLGY